MAVPYLQGYVTAPADQNVISYSPGLANSGYNLYNSGHGPEAILTDMEGRVLHSWRYPIDQLWPDAPGGVAREYWRRVHLFPNGDLLAIFEGIGLIKVDRESQLLWKYRGGAHHQAFVHADGTISVLTRHPEVLPDVDPKHPVLTDFVAELEPDGSLLREWSISESLRKSDYAHLLNKVKPGGDILHTNTLYVLDGSQQHRSSIFRKGNLLISMLAIDTIAIIDPSEEKVIWAADGQELGLWSRQHDPRLLENGNLLLFDNRGREGKSKIIEFDPVDFEIRWQFPDLGTASNFFSIDCGASVRLPNGNTLISESANGRAFEVNPAGQIVWEFLNPNRAGEEAELIATLFEVQRIPFENALWAAPADLP